MAAFTQRQASPKKSGGVSRGSVIRKFESSDEDDDSSEQDDSDEEQSWKRRKTAAPAPSSFRPSMQVDPHRRDIHHGRPGGSRPDFKATRAGDGRGGGGAKGRRRNNVWGSVVVEQNQEVVEREITNFGVDAGMERDVESYNYRDNQQPQLGIASAAALPPEGAIPRGRTLMKAVGEGEDDAWLADNSPRVSGGEDEHDVGGDYEEGMGDLPRDDLRERLKQRGSMVADKFRRSNVRNRLGRKDKIDQVIVMKPIEIDPKAESKVIAGQVAYSLQEPKRHLILRIVKILGVEKCLEIWRKTEEIENDGGMLIRDRSRRRSPGGVFIQLMKTDPDVTQEQISEIFAEEKKAFEAEKKKKKKRERRFAMPIMDVDRQGNNGDGGEEEVMDACSDDDDDEHDKGMKQELGVQQDMFSHEEQQKDLNRRAPDLDGPKNLELLQTILPPPQQECVDVKESDSCILFPKADEIPKRNEDSEPEDGEVIDEDEEN